MVYVGLQATSSREGTKGTSATGRIITDRGRIGAARDVTVTVIVIVIERRIEITEPGGRRMLFTWVSDIGSSFCNTLM